MIRDPLTSWAAATQANHLHSQSQHSRHTQLSTSHTCIETILDSVATKRNGTCIAWCTAWCTASCIASCIASPLTYYTHIKGTMLFPYTQTTNYWESSVPRGLDDKQINTTKYSYLISLPMESRCT